jgi:hypothetical protein
MQHKAWQQEATVTITYELYRYYNKITYESSLETYRHEGGYGRENYSKFK